MKPIHLLIAVGLGFLLLRKRAVAQPVQTVVTPEPIYAPGGKAIELEPVQVTAPRASSEKPIPFPTSFQYEQMPERPVSQATTQAIMRPVFGSIGLAQRFIQEECEKRGGYWSRSGCITKQGRI